MRGINWLRAGACTVVVTMIIAILVPFTNFAQHEARAEVIIPAAATHADVISVNVVVEAIRHTMFGPAYSVGSGVVVSNDGLILTAAHVLRDAVEIRVKLHDGRVFDVNDLSTVYIDDRVDAGFIDLPCDTAIFKEISSAHAFKKKDPVLLVGNPDGLLEDVVVHGTVASCNLQRLAMGKNVVYLLISMKVSPGCSGGGLYWNGKLIGIASRHSGDLMIALSIEECEKALKRYLGRRVTFFNYEEMNEYYKAINAR